MLWAIITAPIILILFLLTANNLSDNFKSKDQDGPRQEVIQIKDRHVLIQLLKNNIGNSVTIQSKDFTRIHDNRLIEDNRKITGQILEVDEDWLNIEFDSRQFIKKDSLDQLILRIDRLDRFYINDDTNS